MSKSKKKTSVKKASKKKIIKKTVKKSKKKLAKKKAKKPKRKLPTKKELLEADARRRAARKRNKGKKNLAGHRENMARARQDSRDIGEIPAVKNPERRELARLDCEYFLKKYFPLAFKKEFSDAHKEIIATTSGSILEYGLDVIACPRGFGKTTLLARICIWAILYGHRRFFVILGATAKLATKILSAIKTELSKISGALMEDFPEVCLPCRKLKNLAQRAKSQLYKGEPTYIAWKGDGIQLPWIDRTIKAGSAGSVIVTVGITGALRGLQETLPNGEVIRPDYFLGDDLQTKESAKSPTQVQERLELIEGDVLGLAGEDDSISGAICGNIIAAYDAIYTLLDDEKYPAFTGKRIPMVIEWPENMKIWNGAYKKIYLECMKAKKFDKANKFYRMNRKKMDKGSKVTWKEGYKYKTEVSTIQSAFNSLFTMKPKAFFAEKQNEPIIEGANDDDKLTVDDVMLRTNKLKRFQVPTNSIYVTMFIDVHEHHLEWCMLGLGKKFSGGVMGYARHPANINQSLRFLGGEKLDRKGGIYKGLRYLKSTVCDRIFRGGNMTYNLNLCLIDAGFEPSVVQRFCRENGSVFMPSMGRAEGPDKVPLGDRTEKEGEIIGRDWMQRPVKGQMRVQFDTNRWKTFSHARLLCPMGSDGAVSVYGDKDTDHYKWAVSIANSERKSSWQGKSNRVEDKWEANPGQENHDFDCLVGSFVAGSVLGLTDDFDKEEIEIQPVSYAEMQRAARQRMRG